MEPRGIRNNNPGNIRLSSTLWKGQINPGNVVDEAFVTFETPEYGLRAMAVILRNYQRKHGLNTIREIIQRWAPAADDNDTLAYINAVADEMDVSPDERLVLLYSDSTDLPRLLSAIVKHENGEQPYSTAQIDSAIAMA